MRYKKGGQLSEGSNRLLSIVNKNVGATYLSEPETTEGGDVLYRAQEPCGVANVRPEELGLIHEWTAFA